MIKMSLFIYFITRQDKINNVNIIILLTDRFICFTMVTIIGIIRNLKIELHSFTILYIVIKEISLIITPIKSNIKNTLLFIIISIFNFIGVCILSYIDCVTWSLLISLFCIFIYPNQKNWLSSQKIYIPKWP